AIGSCVAHFRIPPNLADRRSTAEGGGNGFRHNLKGIYPGAVSAAAAQGGADPGRQPARLAAVRLTVPSRYANIGAAGADTDHRIMHRAEPEAAMRARR